MHKRGRVVGFSAAGVVLVAVVGTLVFGGPGTRLLTPLGITPLLGADRSDLSTALDDVPLDTERLSFTDWAVVRKALNANLGAHPGAGAINKMISRAYDADFSAVSSIQDSAAALQQHFGFSPATMSWEAYAQSKTGAAMVARMPDSFDMSTVSDQLDKLGFVKPKNANGVWLGGIDRVAAIDPTISPELQYVAVIADQHLIVTSDLGDYARKTVAVVLGQKPSLGELSSARDVVAPLTEPAAAMLWSRDFACTDLAMGQDDNQTLLEGNALIAKAGKITPLSGLVMALDADRSLNVSELFESSQAASENLRARATLAVGNAPGRGGTFSDDNVLTSSRTDGATVQLRMKPRSKTGYVLSALDSGPVLFASC